MLSFLLLLILLAAQIVVVLGMIFIFVSGISSSLHGAPFVPIKKKLVKEILAFGGISANDIFYDLGCGDGRVLISAVRDFDVKRAIGYEVSLWPYWIAKWRIRQAGLTDRIEIHRKNFFDADLSGAGFVYMYLFPKLVNQLAEKVSKECRPGTKILCPSFPIDLNVHEQLSLLKSRSIGNHTCYVYERT